jgi:MSHA biogenesis protein MshG
MTALFSMSNRMEDLALFTRHVAGAMNARAPLPDILRAFARDSEGGAVARAVDEISGRVETGAELSAAMDDHPSIFPSAYRRLVRLGEQGKTLGGVMKQLADSLDDSLKTYEYFRRAAIYPLFVIILLFADLCFLLVVIVPKLEAIFEQLGAQLPMLTEGLIRWSQNRTVFDLFVLVLLIPTLFLAATVFGLRIKGVGYGRFYLQLPLIGTVLRRFETARFANNLALLLDNRVPMSEALGLLADSSENTYVRAAIDDLRRRYTQGEKLSELIAAQPLFPASMAAMMASAEDRGGLADTLRGLGKFYSERASYGLTVMREVFEPLMLLLIGVLVGAIMLSLYSPLFNIPRLIGR